jgi:CBS domain-containing protein
MALMFAFEVTQDANALLPLLSACVTAYGFTVLLMPRSILTEKIARRGYHIYREYSVDPLERHTVSDVMTRDPITIAATMTVADALHQYFGANQAHRAYPVVSGAQFVGMVDREALVKRETSSPTTSINTLFGETEPLLAMADETCRTVATRLAVNGLERIPVVNDPCSRELVGLVTRSDLIKPSHGLHDEEHHFEQLTAWPWERVKP